MKYIKLILILVGMLLFGGCKSTDALILEPIEGSSDGYEEPVENLEIVESIWVYISGAVSNPGVYELESGSRICDGIEAAGGLLEDAAGEYVNLARKLEDEEHIYIPTHDEIIEDDIMVNFVGAPQNLGLININTADEEMLCTLPGVGASRAKAIIAYREKNGNFKNIEEIMNVEGIKNGLFSKIEALITVR